MRNKIITTLHTKLNAHSSPVLAGRVRGYFTGSILSLGVLASMGQVHAQEDVSLIQKEINRRAENVNEAQELLKKGDEFYNARDFKAAVESYKKAFELIPEARLTHQMRFAAGDRYAQAAVEYGKILARTGQYDIAKKHLNDVLDESVAPGNAGAMKMLAKLDDPIRYSPTLTPEHVRNIEKVAHGLRKAESYFLQGQYDEALVAYEEVLKVDPTNKAARRGMSRITVELKDYYASVRGEYRNSAFANIDALWETQVKPSDEVPIGGEVTEPSLNDRVQGVWGSKLKQIIVPSVELDDVSFGDAIRSVRVWARELDTTELNPEKKGMNFVTRLGDDASGFKRKVEGSRVNLNLKNVPLSVVLDYITQQTGTYWRQEQFAVVIRPRGAYTAELESRTFRVPVGFLDSMNEKKETDDVFGDGPALQAQTGIMDALKKIGISFPEGSTAYYNRSNNTLRVTNAPLELDAIETYIRAQSMAEKVMVIVKTSVIEVTEETLTELGYDHLIDPTLVKNSVFAGGGTQGNGGQIFPAQSVINGAAINGQPLTSSLRSGNGMFSRNNAIDDRIAGISSTATLATRAPSPLQVTSQINDATFQTILRALDQSKGADVMHQASTISVAGQRASVYSGNEFIYPTEYEPGEIPNGGGSPPTPTMPTAFETRQLGFQMDIEPTVSDDRLMIDMNISPQIVSFDGFIDYGTPLQQLVVDPITGATIPVETIGNAILQPVFKVVRLNTNATIQDGSTLVVGGLLQNRIEEVSDKVPVLGDLPLVGRFFKSEGLKNSKKAVVIFVKVELVDPTGHAWRDR